MAVLRTVQSLLLTLAAVIGAVCIVAVVACLLTGVRPSIVISGSMEPGISTGGMTFARTVPASQLEPRDVVTVERPDGSGQVTHRIVDITPSDGGVTLTLKGDANEDPDPVTYDVTSAGRVEVALPWLGYVADWLRNNLLLAGAILVGLTILVLVPTGDDENDDRTAGAGPDPGDKPDPHEK